MRDGDIHGQLHDLEEGLKYVHFPVVYSTLDLKLLRRVYMLLETFPWIAYHVKKIPSVRARLAKLREASNNRGKERVLRGGQVKDLFYFLVSTAFLSLILSVVKDVQSE